MVKERIVETNEGIQGAFDTEAYDVFMRRMRDKGWLDTKQIIRAGINSGNVLEIGPGPRYLGLELAAKADRICMTGLEISPNMIRIAEKNTREYGFDGERCRYVLGNAMQMPFSDNTFDAVISSGSLHEWEDPEKVFNEIYRVLKKGGRFFVSDLKRNIALPIRLCMNSGNRSVQMKRGLISSINAAYTLEEISKIINKTSLKNAGIKSNPFGLSIFGKKH